VLSRLVRRLLLDALREAFETGQLHFAGSLDALNDRQHFADHLQPARQTDWVVYAKPPFAGPDQVLDYVGRYTHRIAISNQRLLALDAGQVQFRYTDYRRPHAPGQKTMTLTAHGVHPARPPACAPTRLPPHAVLRPARKSYAAPARGTVPAASRRSATDSAGRRSGIHRLSRSL
jgi:hypothetical protein